MLRCGSAAQPLRAQALRRLAAVPRPGAAAAARHYATEIEPERPKPATRQGGNEQKLGRSFQGQVMGSIGARLRREREQREQYEKWRDMNDPARNWMITFCTFSMGGPCCCLE
jgi:D-lactate dehydrogenase (cytochrome)